MADWILYALCAALALSLAVVALGRKQRGRRRRILSRYGTLSFLMLAPITVFKFAQLAGYSFSDTTGALGLIITIVFALLGSRVTELWQRITVGVVMTSRVPFFTEIRRGLREGLDGQSCNLIDEYESAGRALEDLTDFMPCLRRVMRHKPDYLVIACPSEAAASMPETIAILRDLTRRGGAVFFIENAPPEELLQQANCVAVTRVVADSAAGAKVLARYLAKEYPGHRIHLLCGPEHSHPAQIRRRIFKELLPQGEVMVADVSGWTRSGCRDATRKVLEHEQGPILLVCGNDSMALGSVDAVHESGRTDVIVAGYDGVRQVLAAISEPTNPIVATLRTPPSAYGHEIAARIKDLLATRPRSEVHEELTVQLFVDDSNLVTRHNVEALLAELWS